MYMWQQHRSVLQIYVVVTDLNRTYNSPFCENDCQDGAEVSCVISAHAYCR